MDLDRIHREQMQRFKNDKSKVDWRWMVDNCKLFNSKNYWWCYYHEETDSLYDQYGYFIGNGDKLKQEGLV